MSDGPVVGVVGPDAAPVEDAVRSAGATPVTGPASAVVGDCDYVIPVGEPALLAVARATPDVPVLPVAAGRGVRSVPADDVEAAVTALVAGEDTCDRHPLLDVTVGDRTTVRALADVLLVSAEPAQISEYAVTAGGETVARFRADGVVVATPAGSSGYASAAGGPVAPPGTDALVVVPVAPFSTELDHWVVPFDDVRVSVERDETAVHLVADERVAGPVEPADPVELAPGATVRVAVVDASRSPYAGE